jgi:hypothetical protein
MTTEDGTLSRQTAEDRAETAGTADPLLAGLRALPREAAGEGFTARVFERLDRAPVAARPDPQWLPAWRLAAAAALGALALGALVWSLAPAPPPAADRAPAQLGALEAEHASLAAELAEIRRLAEEPVPLLYLGGDDEVDLVLDLGRLARERPRQLIPTGGLRP